MTNNGWVQRFALRALSVALGLLACGGSTGRPGPASAQATYEGFGASTPGGAGAEIIRVTNLDDSGPGSFREAVSQGHRTIVFDVAGTIGLTSAVYVNGAFITIDGLTAPLPGITLDGGALVIRGSHGAHDVIVRGIRVRNTPLDGIQIANGAYNVVIDHVSVHGAGDGNIDITENSHDITVSWSILAAPASDKNMLIKYGASRISLHHNLFVDSTQRNPIVSTDDAGTPATDTTVDIRNNVIWNWGFGVGTMIFEGARANVLANFTSSPGSALIDQGQGIVVCNFDCPGDLSALSLAYVIDNLSGDPLTTDMNVEGNVLDPFPAPAVTIRNAYTAAQDVLAQAGVRPLDDIDQQILATIVLPPRADGPNLSVSFLAVATSSDSLTITERTTNSGTQPTGPSSTKFFLSGAALGGGDLLIATRPIGQLDPGASNVGSLTVPLPSGVMGTYFVMARADADQVVAETSEADNAATQTASIAGPDLIVSAFAVPGGTSAGASISVSETTRNAGTVATSPSTTTFFLSTDAVLDAGDIPLGSRSVPELAAGASHAAMTTLSIPPTPSGAYLLIARADAGEAVTELRELNNINAQPISIGMSPDLMIQSLTVSGMASPGVTIKISDSTKNLGAGLSASTTTRYYLSVDTVADGSDIILGARTVPALASGGVSSGSSIAATVPASIPVGTYFVVARADADDAVSEAEEANNGMASVIEIGFDLTISSLLAPAAVAAGATIVVTDTTENARGGAAPTSTTAFFLSTTSGLSLDDIQIGSRAVPALAPGASDTRTSLVTIPTGIGGDFYIVALANAHAGISGGAGNNTRSRTIRIGPDLKVSTLISPASVTAGATIAVSDVTRNTAVAAAAGSTTKYFLSVTSVLNEQAIVVGGRPVPALAPGGSSSGSASVAIPAGTAPGSYFLIAKSDGDNAVVEYSESNNTRARALTILP